jgi:hypothetical protein
VVWCAVVVVGWRSGERQRGPKHVELILEINKYCYLLHLVGFFYITLPIWIILGEPKVLFIAVGICTPTPSRSQKKKHARKLRILPMSMKGISLFFVFLFLSFLVRPLLPTYCRYRWLLLQLITFRHTHTIGWTPLDEGSALRRHLYLTTPNTHNRYPCPQQDSNPQSQLASCRRPTPATGIGVSVCDVLKVFFFFFFPFFARRSNSSKVPSRANNVINPFRPFFALS